MKLKDICRSFMNGLTGDTRIINVIPEPPRPTRAGNPKNKSCVIHGWTTSLTDPCPRCALDKIDMLSEDDIKMLREDAAFLKGIKI